MSDSSPPRSRVRYLIYAVVILVLAAAVWYFSARSAPTRSRYPQPAWAGSGRPSLVPVRTVIAESKDLPVFLKAIGTVTALNSVTVRSRVDGQLLRVGFEEGQRVKRGQLLAEIDPAPYRIALAQAEGQLKQNVARLDTARSDLERIQNLHTQNLVTTQQLEVQQALVAEREGAVAADQAIVDEARLQLTYTRVEAPIEGRVGLRRIDPGNLVRESDANGLVVITQTKPIFVSFTIPEVDLHSVLDPFRAGETLTVEAWNRSESAILATGVLKTVDNQIDIATGTLRLKAERTGRDVDLVVDIATGTLRLKAEFSNEDERLFPNQFVNVRMQVRTLRDSIVIPSAAVQFGSRGTYVYIIDAENKAVLRDVVLGPTAGTEQAINKGLQPGDAVVLEGLDRLREGSGVVVANESAPTPVTSAP